MNSTVFDATEIRSTVVQLHADIRDSLREVLRVRALVLQGDLCATQNLCVALERLVAVVREHEREESGVLDPYLSQVDAWGAERVRRLAEERRLELRLAAVDLSGSDVESLVRTAGVLVRPLLRQLRREERESLSPNVLRNDYIAIDQDTG